MQILTCGKRRLRKWGLLLWRHRAHKRLRAFKVVVRTTLQRYSVCVKFLKNCQQLSQIIILLLLPSDELNQRSFPRASIVYKSWLVIFRWSEIRREDSWLRMPGEQIGSKNWIFRGRRAENSSICYTTHCIMHCFYMQKRRFKVVTTANVPKKMTT